MTIEDPEVVAAIGQMLRSDSRRTLAVADSLRQSGRSIESTVSGSSMGPQLPPGSRIRIALVPQPQYAAGDVIAYLAGHQLIVHRVVHCGRRGAARDHLIVRGDATLVPDPPVERSHVLGQVTGVARAGGWTSLAATPLRSSPARLVRAVLASLSIAMLHLSPRAATRVLVAMHGGAGELRAAYGAAVQLRRGRSRHEHS